MSTVVIVMIRTMMEMCVRAVRGSRAPQLSMRVKDELARAGECLEKGELDTVEEALRIYDALLSSVGDRLTTQTRSV